MPTRRALSLFVISCLFTLAGCGAETLSGEPAIGADGVDAWPGGRYAVRIENQLGESITAVLFLPPGAERVPAVTVLHGSGGLFRPPEDPAAFDPATGQFERQFREWSEMLVGAGYAALFPASFYSRGSFDWNDDPLPGLTDEDRLRLRAYDAVAATEWLCDHPRVDCGRTAEIGFSNGGSTLILSQYAGLDALPAFPGLRLPPAERLPRVGVAYYPGCGLHGFVGLGAGDYRPRVPQLWIHGSEDDLLGNCLVRARQSLALGGAVETVIYDGVGHGFDGYPADDRETRAETEARAMTMARLRTAFAFAR